MIINKKSWHYNFVQYASSWMPHDLCSYIRAVGIGIFNFSAVTFLIGIAAMINIFQIVFTIHNHAIIIEPPFILVNSVSVILIMGYGIAKYVEWRGKKRIVNDIYEYESTPPKQPNIVVAWLRDKHDKVCRTIKYQD